MRRLPTAAIALAIAATGGLSLSTRARAQDAASPRVLTLDDALSLARRANRNLVVERARLAEAHTNVESAWTVLFPTVTAQGKYTRNYKNALLDFGGLLKGLGVTLTPPAGQPAPDLVVTILKQNQLDGQFNVSMPLLAPAAYPALDAVKKGYRSSEASYQATEDSVLYTVAQTFYAAAVADDVLVVRHSAIDVARATLDNAQTRFAAGTVTKVDVDRAELALVRADQAQVDADQAREQTYRALATLIEADYAFQVKPPESLPGDSDADLDLALHLRPEFRGLILTEQSAEATRDARGWQWAPTLSAFGNAHIGNYVGFTGDDYSWAVGAQLDWTLYDGGARDVARHLASAQAAEAQARADVLREGIRDDLANDKSLLGAKRKALAAAIRGVELAQETLDLVRSQYEAGTVTQVDLLQAQDNLVAAEESQAQAHFDVTTADLALRRTMGTFPPR